MEKYGLIGYPLSHSFSRGFFNEKFLAENIDAEYVNFEIPDIREFKTIIKNNPTLQGLNVTIPYKEQVIPLLDEISDNARQIGAVNVIRIDRSKNKVRLKGFNSDILGFKESIEPLLQPLHKKSLILGTGGSAKAVFYGLKQLGIDAVYVSRKGENGHYLYSDLTPEIFGQYQVVVNCTPVGLWPHTDECPDIPYHLLTPDYLLYDLLYNPNETLFMKKGKERGAVVKNGLEMLILQAFVTWNIWQETSRG